MAELTQHTQQKVLPAHGMDAISIIRQVLLLVGIAGAVAMGGWLVLWLKDPAYGVLYSKLDDAEVSIVLDALQQQNIPYKLDVQSGQILVPASDVHSARIRLASQGLPKSTRGGFLGYGKDDSKGFGVSESMEQARFQLALEQELSHTIASLSNVKSTRIHLAIPKQSVFLRSRQKPSASVVVSLYPGRSIDEGQVAAIAHLVSSSVPNLSIENVTIVDQQGRLLTTGERTKELALSSSQFDYVRKLELSYINRIEDILIPILGSQAVRAQVTADIDFTISEQTQELYNPDSAALRSNEVIDEQTGGGAGAGGVPGALSNQPGAPAEAPETAAAGEEGQGAGNTNTRKRREETRNFELDKTISHTRFASGRLKRISAAIVIDDRVATTAEGVVVRTPRSPEEINRITNLVKQAIGFNIQRGDRVNVINESFTKPVEPEPIPSPPIWEQPWLWDVVKHVIGVILVIVVFFGVLKPLWSSLMKSVPMIAAVQAPPTPALASPQGGELEEDTVQLTHQDQKKLTGPQTPYERNMEIAKTAVQSDPKLVAQVVKNWVNDDG